jgi:hypothetical protein
VIRCTRTDKRTLRCALHQSRKALRACAGSGDAGISEKGARATAIHGKQSVKSLTKQGMKSLTKQDVSLTNIEISDENIGDFKKTAHKFNVDFALKRNDSGSPPKWFVFFKAKDSDSLQAAFNEYMRLTLKKDKAQGPSLTSVIQRAKEIVGQIAAPVKNKNRGEREL